MEAINRDFFSVFSGQVDIKNGENKIWWFFSATGALGFMILELGPVLYAPALENLC